MFALVKYQDGVKQIVPASDIKSFDPTKVNYTKKYKIKWKDGEYYEGVIILVGGTKKEVEEKDAAKRPRVTPFELCESADDTDASVTEKTKDKSDNPDKAKLKEIIEKRVSKAQTNLNKIVTTSGKGNGSRSTAGNSKQVQKIANNEIPSESSANGAIKKKNQLKIKSTVKILEPVIAKHIDPFEQNKDGRESKTETDDGKLQNHKDSAVIKEKNSTKRSAPFKVPSKVEQVTIKPVGPLDRNKNTKSDDGNLKDHKDSEFPKVKDNTKRSVAPSKVPSSTMGQADGKKIPITAKPASRGTGVVQKLHETELNNNNDAKFSDDKIAAASISTSQYSPGIARVQSKNDYKENVGCGSCKKMEKKVNEVAGKMKKLEKEIQDATIESKKSEKKAHDVTSDMKKMEIQNNQLKQALKDKDRMLTEATRLNIDLQSKVLDEFDELKVIVADMKQRAQENLEKHQGVLPVGYKRLDKSMIHLGQDVWITIPQYDSISSLSDTAAKFVKNIAIAVYGTPTLKTSSVTGNVSNRLRNKDKNAVARPKLDPTKLLAIKDALGFWLKTEKKLDEVSIVMETARVGIHISHKIFELLRKDKRNEASYNLNNIPEVNIGEQTPPTDEETYNDVDNDRQGIGGDEDDQENRRDYDDSEPEEHLHDQENRRVYDYSEPEGSADGRATDEFVDDYESDD